MAVEAAVLRARVEAQGIEEAARQLREFGVQIDTTQRNLKSSAGSMNEMGNASKEAARDLDHAGDVAQSASRQMDSVGQSARGLSLDLKSIGAAAVTGAAGFVGFKALDGIMSSVGAAMNFVSDNAIGLNARLEQARIGFTQMLGSAQAADNFLRNLADFAAKSPFEFKDLIPAAQRLKALGIEAENIIPLLTDVGSAVAAMGGGADEIDRVTLALAQMVSNTRVSAEEMRQLAETGIPAWQILSDAIGVSVEQARAMAAEGKIAAQTFIDAFHDFSVANYGDMMAEQAKTWNGAWSSISDTLSMAVATSFKPFFELMTEGAVELSTFLQGEDFSSWIDGAAESARLATSDIRKFIVDNQDELKEFAGHAKDTAEALGAIAVAAGELSTGVDIKLNLSTGSDSLDAILGFAPRVGDTAGAMFNALVKFPFQAIDAGLALVSGGMDESAKAIEERTKEIRLAIQTLTGESVKDLAEWERQNGISFMNAEAVYYHFKGMSQEAWEAIQKSIEGATGIAVDGKDRYISYVTEMSEATKAQFAPIPDQLATIFGKMPEVAGKSMEAIVQSVAEGSLSVDQMVQALSGVPEDILVPAFQDAGLGAGTALIEALVSGTDPSMYQDQVDAIDAMVAGLGLTIEDTASKALNFGNIEDIFVGAVDSIGGAMDHWEGNVDRIDRAIEILNDRMEEHGELSAEDQQRLEELNDARARAVGGIHDQEDAYIDAAIALGDYWDTLDSLNQSLSDGQITQEQYNDALQQANENLDPATRMTLDAAGAQRELADSLTESVEKMGALAVLQGSISEEEFNVVFGIDFDDYMTGADEVKQSAEALTSQAWKVAVEADVSGATSTINAFIADRNASGVGFTEGSASATMSSTGDIVLVAAMDTTPADGALGGLRADIDAFDKTFTITAYFDASAVEAGVAHVNRLMPHSPAEEGPLSTLPNWDALFEGMAVSAAKYTDETVDQLKKYVDTSNSILGLIQTAGEVSGASPVSISDAVIGSVTDVSSRAISSMGAAAADMDTEFVQNASKWANAASTGFGLISSALDLSEKALGQGGLDLPRLTQLMTDVKWLSEHLMESLAWSANYLGPQAIAAGETMATGSQKAMELASAALDFIIAFGKGGRPKVALEEVEQFESDVKFLAEHLVESLGWSADKIGTDMVANAEAMANSGNAAMELVSTALEFLEKLSDYDGAFDLEAVQQFESDVKFMVEHLVESLGWSAEKLDQAAQDGVDLSASAQAFAEHAGPAIELLNDVLDLLENIGDGEQFEHFDLLRENLGTLAEQTRDIANAMDQAADGWAEEISPAAQTFYDAAGESIGLIGETMDALEAMTGFSADSLDEMNIADVAQSIADVTRAVADAYEQASEDWDDDVNPAIEAFNEAAGGSLELVGDTADVIEAMGDWGKDRAGLNVERIAQQMTADITTIIGTVQGLAEQMDGPGLSAAKAFAESAGPVLGMMGSAGDAFEAMLNRSQITEKDKDRFVGNFEIVVEALIEIHELLETEGIQEALAIEDTMETIASILQDAADAIDAVSGGGGGSGGGSGSSSGSRSAGLSAPITSIDSALSGSAKNSLTLESVYAPLMSQEPLFNAGSYSGDYKYSEYVEQLAMAATDADVRKVRPTFMGALSLMLGPKFMRLALGPVAWEAEQAFDVLRQRGYASGGYITADQIALLHKNEHIVPDQSIPMLAEQILAAINNSNSAGASPDGALALASAFMGQSYAEPAAGGNPTVSPLPTDALSGRYISDQFHSVSSMFDEGTQSVYFGTGSYLGSGIDTSWLSRSVLRDMPLHQAYDLLSMIPGFANYVSVDDLEFLRRSGGANSYSRFLHGALEDATLSNEEMEALPYSYFRAGALTPELWEEYKQAQASVAPFWLSQGAYAESLSPEELQAYIDRKVAEILAKPQPAPVSPTLPQPPLPPPAPPTLPSGPIVNPTPPVPSLNDVFRDGGGSGGTTVNVHVYVQDTSPANAALIGQQVSEAIGQRAR